MTAVREILRAPGWLTVPDDVIGWLDRDIGVAPWAVIPPTDEPCPYPESAYKRVTREERVNGFLTLKERTESCQRCGATTSFSSLRWDASQGRYVATIQ